MSEQTIPASRIENRIREIDRQLDAVERLKIERDVLSRLLDNGSAAPRTTITATKLPGPMEAVKRVMRGKGAIPSSKVVAEARKIVKSNAKDLSRTLYSTLNNMKRKGDVTEAFPGLIKLRENVAKEGNDQCAEPASG